MSTGRAIGIDLGTTFSCVGVVQNGRVEIIANDQGNRTTPSCVAFTDKECLIGEAAKRQAITNPTNTVFDVKRLIGRRFDDEVVQDDVRRWPFRVINAGKIPKIEVQYCGTTKHFIAEQISSMVLTKMKEAAEMYLDEKVANAVITVPAYFDGNQRQATMDAGKLAGLNVLRLINEPTAAAIAYGMDKRFDRRRNVLIFDWGGGTFDVSIMSIQNGRFEVMAVGGETHLGGEDITSLLVDHFVDAFKKDHDGKDLTTNIKAISRLRKECEEAKRTLSTAEETSIEIVSPFDGIDFIATLTRARFEQMCSDFFKRTMDAVKTALSDAKMVKADISEIVLVGGSTRIPKVGKMLQEFFDGKEVKRSINADEAVAYGAALLADNLTHSESVITKDLVLVEVTPLSLGIDKYGDIMATVIKRNTPIPIKATRTFINPIDNVTEMTFRVLEGERVRACDNHLLGKFTLADLPSTRRGECEVDVTFEIDESGILNVSAVEMSTGKQNSITITNYRGRLSEKEIEQMLMDTEKYKKEDEKERSRMEAKSELVNHIYSIRKKLEEEEVKQKTSEENRKAISVQCEETIKWADANKEAMKEDYEEMRRRFDGVCSPLMKWA